MVSAYPLLQTKLHLPSPRGITLPRESLICALDESVANGYRLILVSAPAGYGKTTLLASWLSILASKQDFQTAWISLESSENDPVQFWSYVIAALRSCHMDIGEESFGLLRSAQPAQIPVFLTTLLNEIAVLDQRFMLVLDDYHNIQNPVIHEGITFWLEHLPENFHLVVSTRTDPFLPVATFRARRMMLELRLSDLRFSVEEEKEFFRLCTGLNLTETEVDLLEKSTEGWAAGLQLAALSLRATLKESSAGESKDLLRALMAYDSSDRHLLDFFTEEILRSLSPELFHFLVCSSIFDRFCADLCNVSLELEGSAEIISELERNNLFIIQLDMNRHWYRYHHLFSDLLRQRLNKQVTSDQLAGMHLRAASWFEGNSFHDEAVDHYLKAADYENAARVLEEMAFLRLFSGEGETISRWLASFPIELRQQHPGLIVVEAWMNLISLKFQQIEQILQLAEQQLARYEEKLSPDLFNSLQGQIETILTTSLFNLGDIPHTLEHADQALKFLPTTDQIYRSLVYNCLGDIYFTQGKIYEANQYYEQAYTAAYSGKVHLIALLAGSMYGNTTATLGQLQKANTIFENLMEQVEDDKIPLLPAYAAVEEGHARLLLERNKLPEAFASGERALKRISLWGHAEITVRILLTLTQIAWAMQDIGQAEAFLEKAKRLYKEQLSMWSYPRLHLVEAQLLIHQAQYEEAKKILKTAALWPDPDSLEDYSFAHTNGCAAAISILIGNGELDSALQLCETAEQFAKERRVHGAELQVRLLHALVHQKLGNKIEASIRMADVLRSASLEAYCRLFLDKGKDAADLLLQCIRENPSDTAVVVYGRSLLDNIALETDSRPLPQNASSTQGYENLSTREIEILRLVAAGLSNDEIASTLYLSANTVKTHIKRIFSKLYVHNRLEAVNKARELNFL